MRAAQHAFGETNHMSTEETCAAPAVAASGNVASRENGAPGG